MLVNEIFDPLPYGYRSEQDDHSGEKPKEPRKTRLTLAQLNKLRIMNDVRKFEREKKIEKIKKQYAAPAEGGMGGPPGL